jgi:hypothetical protein
MSAAEAFCRLVIKAGASKWPASADVLDMASLQPQAQLSNTKRDGVACDDQPHHRRLRIPTLRLVSCDV